MEIELLLKNIKKISGKLDYIDRKIIWNKDFIPLLKSNVFENLDDFKEFYSELREILEKCPNNKLGPNLLPIDPTTNLEINIDNITVYNEMCYNINTLPKSNSKWKKLLGLFLVSLAGGSAMFNYGDKIPEINSYLKTVGDEYTSHYHLNPLYNIKNDIETSIISSYTDVTNNFKPDTLNPIYPLYKDMSRYNIDFDIIKTDVTKSYKNFEKGVVNKIYPLYNEIYHTYINPIHYQKVFKDFGVHYSEISTNFQYEDIFTMDPDKFIEKYINVEKTLDEGLSIDNKNKVESHFRSYPHEFKKFLQAISVNKNDLLYNKAFMTLKQKNDLYSSYLRKLVDLKIIMENKELYDTLLKYT